MAAASAQCWANVRLENRSGKQIRSLPERKTLTGSTETVKGSSIAMKKRRETNDGDCGVSDSN